MEKISFKVHNLVKSIKLVFKSGIKYWIIFFVTGFVFITISLFLPQFNLVKYTLTSGLFSLFQKMSILISGFGSFVTNFTLFGQLILILITILTAFNITMLVYSFKQSSEIKKASGSSAIAIVFSFIGIGCASCGSVILSTLFGIGASSAFIGLLPFNGQEFGIIAILLLLFSLIVLSNKIQSPNTCSIK